MSALTKFFVVLLVLLSIIQTAGTVVFVNKTAIFNQQLTAADAKQKATEAQLAAAQSELAAVKARETALQTQMGEQVRSREQTIRENLQTIAGKDVEIASLRSTNAMQSADLQKVTEAVKAAQVSTGSLQNALADSRKTIDSFVKKNTDLNLTVSDLTNKLEVTERARRYAEEQLTQAQSDNTQLNQLLKDNGIDRSSVAANAIGTRGGAPAVNGVVRDVREIGGILYATVSVGSSDDVKKGMEFKVIDRNTGSFLGIITIDSVEPNEATGRLEGPRLAEVRPGNEVRTQL